MFEFLSVYKYNKPGKSVKLSIICILDIKKKKHYKLIYFIWKKKKRKWKADDKSKLTTKIHAT